MTKLTQTQIDQLEARGRMAFQMFRRPEGSTAELSRDVAFALGYQARRMGLTEEQVSVFLQTAFGSLFVRQTNLNPGLDLSEVREAMLKAFNLRSEP